MTTVTLGWEGTKAEIPSTRTVTWFSPRPIDATSGNITSWPVGAASTLYFFEGDPVRNATTPIISIPGVVEPPSIDYVVQQETLAPIIGRATHFLLTVSMPETPTQEYPLYYGKAVRRV
ncbi:DUF7264 domain-containing protein [Gordonia westfalica]|uniref:LtfC/p132/Gp6 beta-sandwich domain-containing protein n=1 Tax=Gordonia westfalica TaxID=158898 RepID=A0A1H2DU55_9ACTN|nr:hypothetical protein [Gordonia westfalica]SDT86392.1 hypothetical protein SAMN04488548_1234 [Gordonia westfalica]